MQQYLPDLPAVELCQWMTEHGHECGAKCFVAVLEGAFYKSVFFGLHCDGNQMNVTHWEEVAIRQSSRGGEIGRRARLRIWWSNP